MIARGDTAPFAGNVPVRHLTDPNWKGTAERIYLNYQPSGKTVDQMIEEMKAEESKANQIRAIAPSLENYHNRTMSEPTSGVPNEALTGGREGKSDWYNLVTNLPMPKEAIPVLDTAGAILDPDTGLPAAIGKIGGKALSAVKETLFGGYKDPWENITY